MNVLKPHLQTTVFTLLASNTSQREIARVTKIDRKTIRTYAKRWRGNIRNWKPVLVVHLNLEKPLQTEINQPLEAGLQIKKAA